MRKLAREAVIFMLAGLLLASVGPFIYLCRGEAQNIQTAKRAQRRVRHTPKNTWRPDKTYFRWSYYNSNRMRLGVWKIIVGDPLRLVCSVQPRHSAGISERNDRRRTNQELENRLRWERTRIAGHRRIRFRCRVRIVGILSARAVCSEGLNG